MPTSSPASPSISKSQENTPPAQDPASIESPHTPHSLSPPRPPRRPGSSNPKCQLLSDLDPTSNAVTNSIDIHPPRIKAAPGITKPQIRREADNPVLVLVDRRSVDGVRGVEDDVARLEGADEPGPAVLPRELEWLLGDQARRHHVLVERGFGFLGAEARCDGLGREGVFQRAADRCAFLGGRGLMMSKLRTVCEVSWFPTYCLGDKSAPRHRARRRRWAPTR